MIDQSKSARDWINPFPKAAAAAKAFWNTPAPAEDVANLDHSADQPDYGHVLSVSLPDYVREMIVEEQAYGARKDLPERLKEFAEAVDKLRKGDLRQRDVDEIKILCELGEGVFGELETIFAQHVISDDISVAVSGHKDAAPGFPINRSCLQLVTDVKLSYHDVIAELEKDLGLTTGR